MNDEAVCRTAPATPGLLIKIRYNIRHGLQLNGWPITGIRGIRAVRQEPLDAWTFCCWRKGTGQMARPDYIRINRTCCKNSSFKKEEKKIPQTKFLDVCKLAYQYNKKQEKFLFHV